MRGSFFRSQLVFFLLCTITFCSVLIFTPDKKMSLDTPISLEKTIPSKLGEWEQIKSVDNIIQSPEEKGYISKIYSQVINRKYTNNKNDIVMLSVAYSPDQTDNSGRQSHKPEICYPAQGFKISDTNNTIINTGNGKIIGRHLIAQQGNRSETIVYWTMIGQYSVISQKDVKIAQIKYGFDRIIPDGLIFRVSVIDSDNEVALKKIEDFLFYLDASLNVKDKDRLYEFWKS